MSKISLDPDLERKLIKRIQNGDKKSFGLIFQHYQPHIRAYFLQRRLEEQNCEDLTSIVFERALKGIDNFRWQGLSLSSWLYKIARNILIDFFRDSSKPQHKTYSIDIAEQLPSSLETPEESALRTESSFFLGNLIARLPERESQIVYLKFFEGHSNKEIAKSLKLTETNVSTIIYRTIEKFRVEFSQKD